MGWLPEGYEEIAWDQFGSRFASRTFQRPDSERWLFFRYKSMSGGTSAIQTNGIDPETVVINGMPGDFYQSAVESEGNALIWFDYDANMCFLISGHFDKTVMMRIAENVILEPSAN